MSIEKTRNNKKNLVLRILCTRETKRKFKQFVAYREHKNYEDALRDLLEHYQPRRFTP